MKLKYFKILLLTALLYSCSFLDEDSQDKVYVRNVADLEELLIGGGYMDVDLCASYESGGGYYPYLILLDDDIVECGDTFGSTLQGSERRDKLFGYYTWQARPGANESGSGYSKESGDWIRIYKHINVLNSIIDVSDEIKVSGREQDDMRRVLGETYFLRGAYYFTLVNLYGKPYSEANASEDGVPIKIVGEVLNQKFRRDPIGKVYEQILKDLNTAQELLTGSSPKGSVYQADSIACFHLLSRVHLYMQNWSEALRYARKVINNKGGLLDLNNFNTSPDTDPELGYPILDGFLTKDSPETIFSMGGHMITSNFISEPKSFGLSHDLYDTYEDDDLRKKHFFWTFQDYIGFMKLTPGSPFYGSTDYTGTSRYLYYLYRQFRGQKVEVSENFLFRNAEAYLNGAEAAAYMGDEATANSLLEQLRRNRMDAMVYAPVELSGEALVKFIRDERRRELCLEGHRWFDLRRYQVCEKYPESKSIERTYYVYPNRNSGEFFQARRYVLEAYDPAYTLAIPQEVIQFDGMRQNERPNRPATLL